MISSFLILTNLMIFISTLSNFVEQLRDAFSMLVAIVLVASTIAFALFIAYLGSPPKGTAKTSWEKEIEDRIREENDIKNRRGESNY